MTESKPNFLIILVDELRYNPLYEDEIMEEWRVKHLLGQQLLKTSCIEFNKHYIASTACAPSRTSLFTGQYPTLHNVTQTNGIAKTSTSPGFHWLEEYTVPTLGNYFRVNGYNTYYKGKWHLSDADIINPDNGQVLKSYDINGLPNQNVQTYLDADKLHPYGFSKWVGPEPHGSNPNNSASSSINLVGGRDKIYADDVVQLLSDIEQNKNNDPWLVVASLVNPHDITLYGDLTENIPIFNFNCDISIPIANEPPTANEDLSSKPSAQQSYKNIYPHAIQNITDQVKYRQLYYSLEYQADKNVHKILEYMLNSSMHENTYIIFTSDHGDQLGSHGLFQKWHNAYDESLHVPFIIHHPKFGSHLKSDDLTSHIDIIPTLLNLANINPEKTYQKLKKNFTLARRLVGKAIPIRPLSVNPDIISDNRGKFNRCVYFWTQDNPTFGSNQYNIITGKPYPSVRQPNSVEAIIVYIIHDSILKLFKYARYYNPHNLEMKNEYELYDLHLDPNESYNLINNSSDSIKNLLARLNIILEHERNHKLEYP